MFDVESPEAGPPEHVDQRGRHGGRRGPEPDRLRASLAGQVLDLEADDRAFDQRELPVIVEPTGAVGHSWVQPVPRARDGLTYRVVSARVACAGSGQLAGSASLNTDPCLLGRRPWRSAAGFMTAGGHSTFLAAPRNHPQTPGVYQLAPARYTDGPIGEISSTLLLPDGTPPELGSPAGVPRRIACGCG
jgi:hypothetical protein